VLQSYWTIALDEGKDSGRGDSGAASGALWRLQPAACRPRERSAGRPGDPWDEVSALRASTP